MINAPVQSVPQGIKGFAPTQSIVPAYSGKSVKGVNPGQFNNPGQSIGKNVKGINPGRSTAQDNSLVRTLKVSTQDSSTAQVSTTVKLSTQVSTTKCCNHNPPRNLMVFDPQGLALGIFFAMFY